MSRIKSIVFRIATAVIFSAIGGAINLLLNLSYEVANMLSEVWSIALNTNWIDWLIIGLFGLIGTVIADKFGFFLWLDGLYSHRSYIRRNTVTDINKSLIIDDFISDLEYSVERYVIFITYHDTNKPIIDFIPYIDNFLDIANLSIYLDKTKVLQKIRRELSTKEFKIAMDYYNESSKLLSWLKLVRKCPLTNIRDVQYMEKYLRLYIPLVQQGVCDPIVDFPYYMNNDVIPKIKKLIEEARELINILRSKHIA